MNIHDYAENSKCSLGRITDFTTGVNPLGPSNKAVYAARKEIGRLEIFPDEHTRYLKRYLCGLEKIGKDHIVFGAGSTALLNILLKAVTPRLIGILSPLSSRVERMVTKDGTRIISFPPDGHPHAFIDPGKLCDFLRDVDLLLISRPHDMTGTVIPHESLSRLIGEADRLEKVLVIDEAYRDYTALDSPAGEAVASRSTVILRTFSLFHALAGLRLGYGVGSSGLIKKICDARPSLELDALAPRAAIVSLKDTAYRVRTLKFIEDEKAYVRQKLSRLKGVDLIDTPCNFLLLELQQEWETIRGFLLDRNILVNGFAGMDGKAYIRLPMGRHKANAFFMRTLRRITGG